MPSLVTERDAAGQVTRISRYMTRRETTVATITIGWLAILPVLACAAQCALLADFIGDGWLMAGLIAAYGVAYLFYGVAVLRPVFRAMVPGGSRSLLIADAQGLHLRLYRELGPMAWSRVGAFTVEKWPVPGGGGAILRADLADSDHLLPYIRRENPFRPGQLNGARRLIPWTSRALWRAPPFATVELARCLDLSNMAAMLQDFANSYRQPDRHR